MFNPQHSRPLAHLAHLRHSWYAARGIVSSTHTNSSPWWSPQRITLDQQQTTTFSRWRNVIPAVSNHLCLGAIFAWSMLNQPLMCLEGVVAAAPIDWTLGDISVTFSLVMGGFAWGALFGKYLEKLGPRTSCLIGATSLAGGFGLGAAAIHLHSLPLLYMAGGVWGLSNAWSYVPPVSTLIKWFPERKGFASGACIVGFGGGAMIAAPLFSYLISIFRKVPEYAGSLDSVKLVNQDGRLFAETIEGLKEVVIPTASDALSWGIQEGAYIVGTGSTGAAETFLALGAIYSTTMACAALSYRLPFEKKLNEVQTETEERYISADEALKSRQFWLLWCGFGFAITGSYGIISVGKTMLVECFGSTAPDIVTPALAASFVAAMSLANLSGRLIWSNLSDFLSFGQKNPFYGRNKTYTYMWGIGPPMYLALIWSLHQIADSTNIILPLGVFTVSVMGVLSGFGGAAATRPAIISDLFGIKDVGVNTARQLSAVLPAAYIGPKLVAFFRERSMNIEIRKLADYVEDVDFAQAFGGLGKDSLEILIQQRTVTLGRLLELCPPGTIDPSPYIYDDTMYIMAFLQLLALMTNLALKPISRKALAPAGSEKKL